MKNVAVASGDANPPSSDNEASSPATLPIAVAVAIPSAPPLSNDTDTDSVPRSSDEEAQASAASAREQGLACIRDHCAQHISRNPTSSYVTWIATLHPENARVSVDPRFLEGGNPWWTVYEEAREQWHKGARVVPGVAVTPVVPSAPPPSICDGQDEVAGDSCHDHDEGAGDGHRARRGGVVKCGGGGLLDVVIGYALVLLGASVAFAVELTASFCYLGRWLCGKLTGRCSPPGIITWIPFSVAFVLGNVFQLLDAVLLLVGILLVECIALVNYAICAILAFSCDRGGAMHQTTRKLPHVIRWAFWQTFEDWEPPRVRYRAARGQQNPP